MQQHYLQPQANYLQYYADNTAANYADNVTAFCYNNRMYLILNIQSCSLSKVVPILSPSLSYLLFQMYS